MTAPPDPRRRSGAPLWPPLAAEPAHRWPRAADDRAGVAALRRPPGQPDTPASLGRALKHAKVLANALDRPVTPGNRVELLLDGPATHGAMREAIEQAQDHINLESYIVEADGPGRELLELLVTKRREGVRVNVLYDGFGSLRGREQFAEPLRRAGAQLCEFNPLVPWRRRLPRAFHLRDHRKLLVVDGRVAFTGGVNISSVYATGPSATLRGSAETRSPDEVPWRDTHVRIEGPVVASLQRLFLDHWQKETGRPAQAARYFPALRPTGEHHVGVAACEAGRGRNPFHRALLEAIDAAEERVWLTAAYFVPPRRLVRSLMRAAARGVDVQVVVPSVSDAPVVLYAGRASYGRLLRAGVRLHERRDALLHSKTAVIDGVWAAVGSSNLDWRSVLHNAEANVVVLDEGFAQGLEAVFRDDVARSRTLDARSWHRRGWRRRLLEWVAARFEYFL